MKKGRVLYFVQRARARTRTSFIMALLVKFAALALSATVVLSQPCPPAPRAQRGWNSWDADSNPVTEADILAAAAWMRDNLLPLGFDVVTIDGGWYTSSSGNIIDDFGLPVPDPARFPSSAGGRGLLPLAKQVNAMGLKLGAWTIRGITPEAVAANLPIKGSAFTARDVGVPPSPTTSCSWDPNTLGTNAPSAAADAWYASLADHYVANGLELVKIDCMYSSSSPQRYWWFQAEGEAAMHACMRTRTRARARFPREHHIDGTLTPSLAPSFPQSSRLRRRSLLARPTLQFRGRPAAIKRPLRAR